MDANVNQPQPIAQIFLDSFKLFKKTWLHLIPLTIFLEIVVLSPNFLIYNPRNPWLFLGYFIFSIFVFSTAVYYSAHIHRGEKIRLTQAILVAAKKLFITLIVTILASLGTLI